jgi:ompA/motB domain-containing protein
MKKLVILGTALLALNAIASEGQLKFGYDFSRDAKLSDGENLRFKKGPVLGAEYIFDNQGEFEWGVGAEYKLSSNSGKLKTKEDNEKYFRSAPVYALGKFNLVTTQSGNDALYVLGRAGYHFANEARKVGAANEDISGGLYGAVGLGTEFGPVSLEALYERAAYTSKAVDNLGNVDKSREMLDTFGVRVGYRFGQLKNDRGPKIVKEVVTIEKPVEVIKTQPAPQPKIIGAKTVELPFNCSASEKKCVIRGFKVDGRVPNEAEARDLGTIANVINQFAEGGSIDFVGHTDSTGSDAYNQKLSVSRAQNVARLLKEYGLKNTVSYGTITGRGESQPVDTNNTVKGRYNNRRVELFFQNVDFENVRFVDGN